ncbi:MAG: nuclear transport factor 2 family protein [Verrucomicrobiia bacterium]
MKFTKYCAVLALSMAVMPVEAADQPTLNEKLKPLEGVLGRWEGTSKSAQGTDTKLIYEFTPDFEGNIVTLRYQVENQDGKWRSPGVYLYQWRPEINLIAGTGLFMWGHELDLLVKTNLPKTVWQSSGYGYDGKLTSATKEVIMVDENTMTVRLCNRTIGGETRPESTVTMKRVISSPEQEILKLENAWNDASVKADIQTLEMLLSDEFSDVDPGARVNTKRENLENTKSGKLAFTSVVMDQAKVKVFGDTAVITARNTIKGTENGKDVSGQYRFTDTWIRRDGRWQCVASQTNKIP